MRYNFETQEALVERQSEKRRSAKKNPETTETRIMDAVEVRELERFIAQKMEEALRETERLRSEKEQELERELRASGINKQEIERAKTELRGGFVLQNLRRKFFKFMPWLLPLVFAAKLRAGRMSEASEPAFAKRAAATEQMKREGIDDAQRTTYIPGVSELLYRGITPMGYQRLWDVMKHAPENVITGRETKSSFTFKGEEMTAHTWRTHERNDAWCLYLGLPQKYGSFGISDYQPFKSAEDKYYYKINGWLDTFGSLFQEEKGKTKIQQIVEFIKARAQFKDDTEWEQHVKSDPSKKYWVGGLVFSSFVDKDTVVAFDTKFDENIATDEKEVYSAMGSFKLSKGVDERGHYISYYDKWNLERSVEGEEGLIGKSFEIYDRIYYDPISFAEAAP